MRGGTLKLHDREGGEVYELTRDKFLKGLARYLKSPTYPTILDYGNQKIKLDTCLADAGVADMIIQYAVFDDIIYA